MNVKLCESRFQSCRSVRCTHFMINPTVYSNFRVVSWFSDSSFCEKSSIGCNDKHAIVISNTVPKVLEISWRCNMSPRSGGSSFRKVGACCRIFWNAHCPFFYSIVFLFCSFTASIPPLQKCFLVAFFVQKSIQIHRWGLKKLWKYGEYTCDSWRGLLYGVVIFRFKLSFHTFINLFLIYRATGMSTHRLLLCKQHFLVSNWEPGSC